MIEGSAWRRGALVLAASLALGACGGQATGGQTTGGGAGGATPSGARPTKAGTTASAGSPNAEPSPAGAASPAETSPVARGEASEAVSLPTGLSGSVFVTGSSTVEPISAEIAERLRTANPGLAITVEGPGTGDGFEKFCNGEADISDASRAIQDEERQACQANGIEPIELKVAIDGLSVITSTENDQVGCLSFADLYALIGPESTGFENWSDAQALASELGSRTTFPDAELTITAPGEESGTYDSFVELVLEGIAEERGHEPQARPDYDSSPNDNVIVEGIGGSPSSLGWVGFAFAVENQEAVRQIAVSEEPNGECVEPAPETIASGEYPISRPLFIYVDRAKAQDSPAVRAYVDYYLGEGVISSVLEQVPYVALEPQELDKTRQAWTGAGFGD